MWLQFDWGQGPVIDGRPTLLFCAWLAWKPSSSGIHPP